MGKALAHLANLGSDNGNAVTLGWVVCKVVLVVVLGRVKLLEFGNLGDDSASPHLVRLCDRVLKQLALLRGLIEHGGAVLRPDIVSLSV